jgi:hypothetical protein
MSGVGLTGLIKPLNGGSFPVFEDIDGLGGFRVVVDTTARDAIPPNYRKVGMVVTTSVSNNQYQLQGGILNANWVQLNFGTQGAQGAQGPGGGAQGAQGAQGFQGSQGTQGAGFQGAQGNPGVDGATGAQGFQGAQGGGFQGAQGFQGATGAQGSQGAVGAQGQQGFQGATGTQGFQGAQGAQGFQGSNLPAVTATDAGDILQVSAAGAWAKAADAFVSFATVAARTAYTGLIIPGMICYVTATQCLYLLASDGTTWNFYAPSPALASQTAWAIDISAGSDNNSGAPGSPLATTEELSRRLCPRGATWTMTASVAITIAAGSYGSLELNYEVQEPTSGVTLTITGAITSVADMLTSVVNTTTSTQGRITIATGPVTARQRIRSTSGANVGAITYGVGALNSSTDTFVKTWLPNTAGAIANVNIANGTTVALDTLQVTIARCVLKPVQRSSAQLTTTVNDCIFPNGIALLMTQGSGNALLFGCKISGGRSNGNARLVNCQITGVSQFSFLQYGSVGTPTFAGCAFSQVTLTYSGVSCNCNVANCFDASTVSVSGDNNQAGTTFGGGGTSIIQEWSNGAGLTAITLQGGTVFNWQAGQIIGFGTAYDVGYSFESGASAVCSSVANVQIPSTQNLVLAGNNFSYTDLPIALPEADVAFSVTPDTAAVSTTGATVTLAAAARGNIAPTNVFAANPRKGMYRFQAYLAITVAGTLGVPLVQATWTDDSGVAQTTTVPFFSALNVTTPGGASGELIIETNGSTQVQYSVIGVTTQGSLQYSLRINCRIESPG